MIKNIWSDVEFFCMNHPEPIPLYEYKGSHSPFLSCRRYMKKDENHPDGHEEAETACSNRLSYDSAIRIIERLMKDMEESIRSGDYINYKGYSFKYRGIRVKVLDFDFEKGFKKIGVLNEAEIEAWHG